MHPVPVSPTDLPGLIVDAVVGVPGRLRLAVDGAPAAQATTLADAVAAALPTVGRPAVRVSAADFWRPASVRLEHGHTDLQSYREVWLDEGALRREVLEPFAATGDYLPALWDAGTDRSARAAVTRAAEDAVLVVDGSLLLERGLPFDLTVHIRLSGSALRRRTSEDLAWTIPAYEDYAGERVADMVIRADDPAHPAVVLRDQP